MNKKEIYCFDFDGTLTTSDTFIQFIKYAKGSVKLLLGFLRHAHLLVLMKLHLYPNGKAKQKIFAYFFAGMNIQDFNQLCLDFAADSQHLLRQAGTSLIQQIISEGAPIFVVSASIDNWVRPFFSQRGWDSIEILGTQIEVKDGKVTGQFLTPNCYGPEKVRRIYEALTERYAQFCREQYCIEAFGDSRGDTEMLAFADQANYKPFRELQ